MGAYFFDSQLAKDIASTESYVTDKELSAKSYMNYMMIRLQKMFKYENLPSKIPQEMFEYYLLYNGTCFVTEVNGELYALFGSYGGELDPYYRPTRYIVANPGLKLTKDFDIVDDGVLCRNDCLWLGLYPLLSRYATLMAENSLTLRTADIMLRVLALLSAPDDKTKLAAEEYLRNLEQGKLGVIGENRFLDDGIKLQSPPSNNGSYLTQFIELHQYLKGSFYNEIGLNANFNMKRESIGDGESSLNEDSLLPLSDQMLLCRQQDIDKINKKYGTNITVDFDSAWADNVTQKLLEIEKLKNEASQLVMKGGTDEKSIDNRGNVDESSESSNVIISGSESQKSTINDRDENSGISDIDSRETSNIDGESVTNEKGTDEDNRGNDVHDDRIEDNDDDSVDEKDGDNDDKD